MRSVNPKGYQRPGAAQPVVAHLAGLRDAAGRPLVTCCTFDNRGIGQSSIPERGAAYSTRLMAHDVLGAHAPATAPPVSSSTGKLLLQRNDRSPAWVAWHVACGMYGNSVEGIL